MRLLSMCNAASSFWIIVRLMERASVRIPFNVKPNLTLNLGLRYEVASPWWDTIGQLTTVVPGVQSTVFPTAPLGYLVPGDPGVPRTISPTRWNNFAPRIGAAYSPSASSGFLHALFGGAGESSIRAAYGIYYLGAADIGNSASSEMLRGASTGRA